MYGYPPRQESVGAPLAGKKSYLEGMGMTVPFVDSFKGRSVFATGHTGFKGSWLALWLNKLGAKVTGYSLLPPTDPSNFVASRVKDVLNCHHEADVRDSSELHPALKKSKPDVIFHLAAQPLVLQSYSSPRETFDINLMGTACLLDGVRAMHRPCVVIIVTSDKCYANHEKEWGYSEEDPIGGHDPYSASKGATELMVAAYRRSFFPPDLVSTHGVKLATVRAGNVIGGGDWAKDRLIVDIIKALSKNLPVPVRHPEYVRPWQHVLDPLSGYLTLASRMLTSNDQKWCSAWNFGPLESETVSVREVVEKFCNVWGDGSWRNSDDNDGLHEAAILRLNIKKATRELGWRPRWALEQAIDNTARWYRCFYNGATSMREACEKDIIAYEESPLQ
jgi:CDP-glucose 4,6-dehydratase